MTSSPLHPNHIFPYNVGQVLLRHADTRVIPAKAHFCAHTDNIQTRVAFETMLTDSSNQPIILTTGCGMPSDINNIPLRLPELIIPGLQLLQNYKQVFGKDRPIQYHVYQAGDFISRLNNIQPDKAKNMARVMQNYLTLFTEEFYPDLKENVTFDFNKDVSDKTLQPIETFLKETVDPDVMILRDKITAYAGRKDNRTNPLIYAAANIYFNGLNDQQHDTPTTIIPIGCQKEQPFFYLTSLYHQDTPNITILPLTFNYQSVPAYFPYRNQDITFAHIQNGAMMTEPGTLPGPVRQIYQNILGPIGATPDKLKTMALNAMRL